MTKARRALALLLLVAALALALLGQYYFFGHRDYLWDGLIFHGLAVLCFLLAWRTSRQRPEEPGFGQTRFSGAGAWLKERRVTVALLAIGLFLTLAAVLLARDRAWDEAMTDVVILWLLGVAAVLVAAFWPGRAQTRHLGDWRMRLRQMSRRDWFEVGTVVGLTVLALLLRVTELGSVPSTLGGDEAWHGLLARMVLQDELRNPFVMGYMSMPTLFYWPLGLSLHLAGNDIFALRLPAALVGAATVPLFYLFARRMWGRRLALLSTAFLVSYSYHVHFSRLGANNVWDALFVLLTLWALDCGLTSREGDRRKRYAILAGLVMGLSVYFYTGARLLPAMVAAYMLYFPVRRFLQGPRRAKKGSDATGSSGAGGYSSWWFLVLLFVAFLVAAAPMLDFALSHPDDWNARTNQVGILQSGWLEREPELSGKSTAQILSEQFLRAAGAFHVYADRTAWYSPDRPLLGVVPGIFALLGMAWATVHLGRRRNYLVLVWFWSVIITGGMLTESPPSSQRLVLAIPAVVLLVAIGLEQVVQLARRLVGVDRRWGDVAMGLLVLVMALSNIRFYFLEYTPSRRYGSENGETATMIGHYLRGLPEGHAQQVYFHGAPDMYWTFGTMIFMAPDVQGQDIVEPLSVPPNQLEEGRRAIFLFLPERHGELAWVQEAIPGGLTREVRDAAGNLRFVSYEVGP